MKGVLILLAALLTLAIVVSPANAGDANKVDWGYGASATYGDSGVDIHLPPNVRMEANNNGSLTFLADGNGATTTLTAWPWTKPPKPAPVVVVTPAVVVPSPAPAPVPATPPCCNGGACTVPASTSTEVVVFAEVRPLARVSAVGVAACRVAAIPVKAVAAIAKAKPVRRVLGR
jgi:hypothetical protein